MIITITCNPALDKTIGDKEHLEVGGKGINVSKALKNMGIDSLATGFLGKENAQIFIDNLNSLDIANDFILIEGKSRTNTKTIINGQLFEQNESGPFISDNDLDKLKAKLMTFKNDIVILSGSISKNVRESYYQELVELLKNNNCYVILDCSGIQLTNGLISLPNSIKPNKEEFLSCMNISEDKIVDSAKKLADSGIETIIVSLGKEGSLFLNQDGIYVIEETPLNYVSSLCAGDCMVAGLAYSRLKNLDTISTIKVCNACASAAVENIGVLSSLDEVKKFIDKTIFKKITQ